MSWLSDREGVTAEAWGQLAPALMPARATAPCPNKGRPGVCGTAWQVQKRGPRVQRLCCQLGWRHMWQAPVQLFALQSGPGCCARFARPVGVAAPGRRSRLWISGLGLFAGDALLCGTPPTELVRLSWLSFASMIWASKGGIQCLACGCTDNSCFVGTFQSPGRKS